MKQRNNLRVLLLTSASCLSFDAAAEKYTPMVDDPEPSVNFLGREEWKEAKTEIPPLPRDGDLIRFEVDDAVNKDFTYAIDKRSLSVGEDRVVRYTLVIESRRGVRNYAFEGLRCHTKEYKVYAYGSSKGKMRARKDPQWKKIKDEGAGRVHRDLHFYYMCEPSINRPLDKKEIILSLKGTRNNRAINFLKPW